MQTRLFRNMSSLFLLAALLWQTAFATGLQAYCIGSTPDAKIHVCSGPVVCVSESTDGCQAAPVSEGVSKSCCSTPESTECKPPESGSADDEDAAAGGTQFCTPDHQCQLVPHHVTAERPTATFATSITSSFLPFTFSDEQLTAALRTLTGDSSPPRQVVQLLRTASRRAPPVLL